MSSLNDKLKEIRAMHHQRYIDKMQREQKLDSTNKYITDFIKGINIINNIFKKHKKLIIERFTSNIRRKIIFDCDNFIDDYDLPIEQKVNGYQKIRFYFTFQNYIKHENPHNFELNDISEDEKKIIIDDIKNKIGNNYIKYHVPDKKEILCKLIFNIDEISNKLYDEIIIYHENMQPLYLTQNQINRVILQKKKLTEKFIQNLEYFKAYHYDKYLTK